MAFFDRNFREIFVSQVVSVIGGLIAGTVLAVYVNKIFLIPGMFILLPGFLEMRGNISGSFASRLSSGLFLGVVSPHKYRTRILSGNLVASFLLAVIVCLALGLLAFIFNYIAFQIITPEVFVIALVAGMIANAIEIPLTLFFTFYFFKKGHDPNNIMGPFITSTGDVTSVIALLIAVAVI